MNDSICGNGIIESNEVCDTGSPSGGPCCIACKTIVGECDPSQGPCCGSNCLLHRDNRTCVSSNDCRDDIRCNGASATCPITQTTFYKPDLTLCNNNTQVCRSGVSEYKAWSFLKISKLKIKLKPRSAQIRFVINMEWSNVTLTAT